MSFSTTLIRIASLPLLIDWLLVGCTAQPDTRRAAALFPMVEQGRWGFIDSTGAVVVAPRFAQVQEFAEGLAPVREAGHYGFMDGTGHLVLAQSYGYASPFHHGLAVVQQDSTPQLIDRMGHLVPLAATYKALEWQPGLDQGGMWVGTLASGQRQLLAANGQLLTPTQFEQVKELSNNRIVVRGPEPLRNAQGLNEVSAVGVLDRHGRFVIPYYRFHDISAFREGLALVSIYQRGNDDADHWGIIDTTGRLVARLPPGQYFSSLNKHTFSSGLAQVNVTTSGHYPNNESYPAPIDHAGRILFHNRRLQWLTGFYHGRAWAQEKDGDWYLIDKAGHRLSTVAVQFLLGPGGHYAAPAFANGAEVVELANNEGYAALDSTGRVVRHLAEPLFCNSPQQAGDLLLFYGTDSLSRMGFWNWRTGLLVRERFSAISYAGYQHGLLPVLEDNRLGYLSPQGRYVWRAKPMPSTPLNLDFMRRGIYPVASAPLRRYAGAGGWGQSDNRSKPIGTRRFAAHTLGVQVAQRAAPGTFGKRYHGYALTISNTTADTVVFDAQDSSLSLTIQAQDRQGQWHDIEYSPSSWCGNSYHQVFLAPSQYWQLAVPAYAGEFRTQLRARLLHRRGRGTRSQQVLVYSNSFAGSVNPAQFWRPQGYSPQGIMDPYLN
jgi:hypothetical protein